MKITLGRAEGPAYDCGGTRSYESFAGAETTIRMWARTAPADGGYDKVDVSLYLDSNHAFKFRFDMDREHATACNSLYKEALAHCRFWGGLERPHHIPLERYAQLLREHGEQEFWGESARLLEAHWTFEPCIQPQSQLPPPQVR